ncbi:MAG TPA: histidine kinase [Cyclobacteriaceae bacterium]|nr:histidine kinase [Cyclobacteriaceae bacterium]
MTNDNSSTFEKLEFWALTAVFIFTLPVQLDPEASNDFRTGNFPWQDASVDYYANYLVPIVARYVVIFLTFLYLNFKLFPALLRKEFTTRNLVMSAGIVVLLIVLFFITGIFLFSDSANPKYIIFQESLLSTAVVLGIYGGYLAVRYAALFILSKSAGIQSFFVIFNRDSMMVLGLWMILTYFLLLVDIPIELWLAWFAIIPSGILLHGMSFHLFIPSSLRWKYPLISYFFKVFVFCFLINFAIALPIMITTDSEDKAFAISAFTGVLHFFITAPALWLTYRWRMKGREQIYALKSELGQSAANLDFLRSQINPHFLFNALNTIYGLAIHEKAERTSEAVEKLGEMMRFMLNENTQERISLLREIEYLSNYISLQKLRTDSNPLLRIQVEIPEETGALTRITPMLLIPFVENAFKHGISMREESYIKISLELKETTLYFDVLNSTHAKTGNDPEKDSNGIGLANVRHRLQHSYPGRHELLIRHTNRDFFVHLRLELD